MADYEIDITRTAEKCLKKLPRQEQRRIVDAVLALATDPWPRGSRKLQGYADIFRIRVGSYRILYSVEERRLIIIILKIGHRGDIEPALNGRWDSPLRAGPAAGSDLPSSAARTRAPL